MYECKRCGYTTQLFYNFNRHRTRKLPCKSKICQIVTGDGNEYSNTQLSNNYTNVANASANIDMSTRNINMNSENIRNNSIENLQNIHNSENIRNNSIENLQNIHNSENIKDDSPETSEKIQRTYECDLCSKILSTNYNLKIHKLKCKGVHSLQCPTCKKEFSTAQTKHYHLKNVKCIPIEIDDEATTSHVTNNNTNNNTSNVNSNNSTINNNTNNNTNNITNNNTNNNNNNTINHTTNIQINAFGSENIDYLIGEHNRLRNILQKKNAFMQRLVEAVHFDENHPENHNIMMTNLQSKHIMIHDGTKFVKALKEPTFDKLIQKKRNIIHGNIEELGLTIGSERYIKEKLDSLRNDDEKRKTLKNNLELLCYNNKEASDKQIL